MADLDLAKIKRNVAKMAAMGAPVEDIDGYITSEGTTIDAVREFRAAPSQTAPAASASPQGMDGGGQRWEGGVPVGGQSSPLDAPPADVPDPNACKDAPKFGGVAMNSTAGLNEGVYGLAGLPIDLAAGGMNLGIRGLNAVAGTDIPTIDEPIGGSRSIGRAMGAIRPELDPANTEANTTGERIARGAGQGVAGTVLPAGAVGAAQRAGVAVSPLLEAMAGRSGVSLSATAGDAIAGGAAGAGSAAAMEAAPDQYDPLAGVAGDIVGGGLGAVATGIPGLMREGGRLAARAAEPFTAGGQQQRAGRALREGASDPQAILDADPAASVVVPGSQPTTGQLTGDMGVLAMERASQSRFPAEFNQRRADQNTARVAALEGIQPKGAPEKVAQSVRSFLRSIDDETETALGAAMEAARKSTARVGAGMRPEEAGAAVRASLETARATAKERERSLWSAVDPDGTLALQPARVRAQAADIVMGLPASARPPTGEEAAILDVLGRYGDVVPFGEVTALSSRLKAEMRSERMANGESPAYRRLAQLNGALQQDLDAVVAGKARYEAREVAEGRLAPEDTLMARAQQWSDEWYARKAEAGNVATGSAGANAGGGSTSISGPRGTARQAGNGLGNAPGDPRLSGDAGGANFDGAARERLSEANAATRERAQTFDNSTLGPIRRRPATNAPYDMPSAVVPSRIFFGRPQSAEAIGRYGQAVGPEQAMATVEPYAVDQARRAALNDDGTFDPLKLDRWRRQHQDALRAFPELDARLADAGRAAETMAEVAVTRRQAKEAAQKGTLGKFVGIESPEEVTRTVGALFGRQDGPTQLRNLKRAIGDDKDAQEGLRKALADHITGRLIGNTEVGTSGQAAIKGDQFQTFVRQNAPLLRVVFSPEELRAMEAVALDIQRSNRSLNAVRIPGQSNTAQDMLAVQSGDGASSILAKVLGQAIVPGGAAGGGVGFAVGSPSTMAAGAGAVLYGAMRQMGLQKVDELVRDALLDPRKAKILLETTRPGDQAKELDLARRFRAASLASGAMSASDEQDQPQRGPMPLPSQAQAALPPMSSGNPLADALAARGGEPVPPWMQAGEPVSDLRRALAGRGVR